MIGQKRTSRVKSTFMPFFNLHDHCVFKAEVFFWKIRTEHEGKLTAKWLLIRKAIVEKLIRRLLAAIEAVFSRMF